MRVTIAVKKGLSEKCHEGIIISSKLRQAPAINNSFVSVNKIDIHSLQD